jgi:hypothetical protein
MFPNKKDGVGVIVGVICTMNVHHYVTKQGTRDCIGPPQKYSKLKGHSSDQILGASRDNLKASITGTKAEGVRHAP